MARAQPHLGYSLQPSFGLAFSSSYAERDREHDAPGGFGPWLGFDVAYGMTSFAGVRAYSAWINAKPTDDEDEHATCARAAVDCEVSARGVLLGTAIRLVAPIPWFAPFIEIGVGGSLGRFRTETLTRRIRRTFAVHSDLGLGVALGPGHNVEIAVRMFTLAPLQQIIGFLGASLSIPLEHTAGATDRERTVAPSRP